MGPSLVGRVTVVTNCCTAMGKAISRRLGKAGSRLVIADSHAEKLDAFEKELRNDGCEIVAVQGITDLRSNQQRCKLINESSKRFGGIDYLIANMGENKIRGNVMDVSADQFDEMMTKYVTVPFRLVQQTMPLLEKSGRGCVILLSSISSFTPFIDCGLYSIAQNAVVSMCKALSVSAACRRVRVNCVATGFVQHDGSAAIWDKSSHDDLQNLSTMIPIGRLGRPQDCTGVIHFLLSDDAKYITGENTIVNGGLISDHLMHFQYSANDDPARVDEFFLLSKKKSLVSVLTVISNSISLGMWGVSKWITGPRSISIKRRLRLEYSTKALSISSDEYMQRRRMLVERIKNASASRNDSITSSSQTPLVIVTPSAQQQFSAPDVPYPFRQCSYFRYLCGLPLSDATLTIVAQPNQKAFTTLYFDGRSAHEELWEGPTMSNEEIISISGIDEVKKRRHLYEDLDRMNSNSVLSFDFKQFPNKNADIIKVMNEFAKKVPLREHIDCLRWIKSESEQNLMKKTCDIGARAMNAMISRSRSSSNENQIVGRLEFECRHRGASCLAYPPVVAAGNRANTIHYLDCTRVHALNDVQSKLLNITMNVRPLQLNELYFAMLDILSKNLQQIGLFKNTINQQELITLTDKICPHHVSHYLGMDVHDTATVPRNIPLQPGVIFTVEPGIYIREDNELVHEEFRGIGLRIEDDVLVTENSVEILTKHSARQTNDIEYLMKL
ncbi:unnamed protein product [Anisakis simplex]|uniref:Probable Xaa-Pro aminopeptidase 3 (inferred by orthology to a human protein) n=1 Tax=Anisakis simplex TaxID=6269 RepID=A0A0M3JTW4_ANISI|nr:unnamed protein product [Anisakis simplex]